MKHFRYAVLSDVSANLEALNAVIEDIKKQDVQKIFCLGNLLGYGPDPLPCVKILKRISNVCLHGHIEYSIFEKKYANGKFNAHGKEMIDWTRSQLQANPDCWNWLLSLENIYREDRFTAAHTDPRGEEYKPIILKNILHRDELPGFFSYFEKTLFIGGNGCSWFFTEENVGKLALKINNKYNLNNLKTVISVGSVGRPQDGDARACYTIFSNDLIIWRRVNYEVEKTVAKIKECSALSNILGLRLLEGR
ncbi:metallophosphoesterase [Candidatus Uabimicrobium sp. HlEnr_7]|uniref:metallophosphoesterase family protein n=1 Tax=Candidatus Uabimicrobium helgolandensis TaxID=3095367 RepID=UPI003557D604